MNKIKYFTRTHDVQSLQAIEEQEDEQAQQTSHSDRPHITN